MYRFWPQAGAWLDQSYKPHGVAYTFTHWPRDNPVAQPTVQSTTSYANELYHRLEGSRQVAWMGHDGTFGGGRR
jgi:hypothetical protein